MIGLDTSLRKTKMFKAYLKQFFIVAICALCSVSLSAQTAAISGTITDANSQVYANGTYTITFRPVPGNSGPYYQKGTTTSFTESFTGSLDSNGSFSGVTLQRNDYISPAQTSWTFKVCSQASAPCYSINLVIAASSVDISTLVTPPAIQVSPGALQLAYSDSEIIPSGLGSEYSNLTDNSIHYCTAVSGNSCSSWSIAANSESPVIQNLTSIHPAITPTSIETTYYADQYPSINSAVAAIGATPAILACGKSAATLTASLTIPANIALNWGPGCPIGDSLSGYTLVVLGPVLDGSYQIFNFAHGGAVSFASNHAVSALNIMWWGAVGDGATVSTSAIQAAMTASEHSPGAGIYIPSGIYRVCNVQMGDPATKVISGSAQAPAAWFVDGDGRAVSTLKATSGCSGYVLQRNNISGIRVSQIGVDGNGVAEGADFSWLTAGPAANNIFMGIIAQNYVTEGLDFDNENDSTMNTIQVRNAVGSGAVALSILAPGGGINMDNIETDVTGVMMLSAQNGNCDQCNIFGGAEWTTASANTWNFDGGQFYAGNHLIAFDFSNTLGNVGESSLTLHSVRIIDDGGVAFAGKMGGPVNADGVVVTGTGSIFGTITGTYGTNETIFTFKGGTIPTYTASGFMVATQDVVVGGTVTGDNPLFGAPSFYGQPLVMSSSALTVGWNYTQSAGEADFFDNCPSCAGSFRFYDYNGGTPTLLANLTTNGFSIASGTPLATSNQTGTGNIVLATSPSIASSTLTGTTTAATLNATTLEQSSQAVVLSGANGLSRGTITISSATSGAHTFTTAYGATPVCVASENSATPTALVFGVTSSTTVVTITLSTSGSGTFTWSCGPAVN
jgi:hypothetical protein